jgi:hypothetical protein
MGGSMNGQYEAHDHCGPDAAGVTDRYHRSSTPVCGFPHSRYTTYPDMVATFP